MDPSLTIYTLYFYFDSIVQSLPAKNSLNKQDACSFTIRNVIKLFNALGNGSTVSNKKKYYNLFV